MSTYSYRLSSSKAFYRVAAAAAELCKAAQLTVCVYLGYWCFYLGVLRRVFGVRYAVSVLVTSETQQGFPVFFLATMGHSLSEHTKRVMQVQMH